MPRGVPYLICVVAFSLPVAGLILILWSMFDLGNSMSEDLHAFAIVGLSIAASMMLARLPGR